MTERAESNGPGQFDGDLSLVFRNIPTGLGLLDCDLRYVWVNERLAKINGRPAEDHIGRTVFEVIPDVAEKVAPAYHRVIETGEPVRNLEITAATPAAPNALRNFLASYLPWKGDDNEIQGVSVVVEDISERKEAEHLLGKSQSIAHIGNWSITRGKDEVVLSDEVCRIYGFPIASTCTFEMFTEVIHPDDLDLVISSWMDAIHHGRFDFTYRILVDGQLKWVIVKAETVFHEEDETISAVGTAQDITDRIHAEEALKESLRFQELASGISTRFSGLSGVEFEQAIHDALAEIGHYFGTDTIRLYRLSLQGDVVKIRNMWRDERLAPPEEMDEIHKLKYPNLAAHYAAGEATVFSNYNDSPPWPEMRKILKFFGTKAGVGVPLEIDDSGVDVFAMDKVRSEHVWPENIIKQSKAIGAIMLSAMRRREAEVELQESYDEIRRLKERLEAENIYLRQEVHLEQPHAKIIGQSPLIRKALQQVEQVARTNSTVLIEGETGTGKELLALAIHELSSREKRTLVNVNCAALPDTLVESELFGREKGAYTGAMAKQVGRFEIADGSTLFLDEIGELSLEVQAKLLRVLQDGKFERLGSTTTVTVDVRIIAATNRDLQKAVEEGTFREDLYYRLRVFPITVPPLRERQEDIPQLVWHFVQTLSERMGKRTEHISKLTMEALQRYPWPGNIRQLRNIIEHAMIISTGPKLIVELPTPVNGAGVTNQRLEDIERKHIIKVLEQTRWRVRGTNGAAEILALKPTTLDFRMKKLGIVRPR